MVAAATLTTVAGRETAILRAIRALPRGKLASYGEIARRAGLPGRARLVGSTLRKVADQRVPWHRVTAAQGRIAFAAGSAPFHEQVRRLQREGWEVKNGRVIVSHGSVDEMDRLLWVPKG